MEFILLQKLFCYFLPNNLLNPLSYTRRVLKLCHEKIQRFLLFPQTLDFRLNSLYPQRVVASLTKIESSGEFS